MSIWNYSKYFDPEVKEAYQISLEAGNTPARLINSSLSGSLIEGKTGPNIKIYAKREDLNPTGSHKDRSLTYQICAHLQESGSDSSFAISSSGNSAISAAAVCKKGGNALDVFISHSTPNTKLHRLKNYIDKSHIHFSKQPKKDAILYSRQNNAIYLRGSTDPYALEGFKTISFELDRQIPQTSQIFIPCSSGTTTFGIYRGYQLLQEFNNSLRLPQLHIAQSTKVHPIAKEFDQNFKVHSQTLAQAITDRVAHRKKQVIEAVRKSGGYGWIINDNEINKAASQLQSAKIECSPEGAMTLAAMNKALERGFKIETAVLLITGTK